LETTFLVDLLNGVPAAIARAKELEDASEVKCVAGPAAAEVLVGAYYIGGPYLARGKELLDSLILLSLDMDACHEAGQIGSDLLSRGESIGAADLLIAAVSKRHNQRLLTRDRSYSKVRGLTVETY